MTDYCKVILVFLINLNLYCTAVSMFKMLILNVRHEMENSQLEVAVVKISLYLLNVTGITN